MSPCLNRLYGPAAIFFCLLLILLFAGNSFAEPFDASNILAAHNKWRKKVGAGKLSYSGKLATSAQDWANSLRDQHGCSPRHSKPGGNYGENIFWASAIMWSDGKREVSKISPAHVVNQWGNESKDYTYRSNTCKPGKICGHYTQLVWKSTTHVGCGKAVCADSKDQVWVCQYQPPGNWIGQKPY